MSETYLLAKMYGVNPASGTTTQHGYFSDWMQAGSKSIVNLYRTSRISTRRLSNEAAATGPTQSAGDPDDLGSLGAVITSAKATYIPPMFNGILIDDFERNGLVATPDKFWNPNNEITTAAWGVGGSRVAVVGSYGYNGYLEILENLAVENYTLSFDFKPSSVTGYVAIYGGTGTAIVIYFGYTSPYVYMTLYDGSEGTSSVPLLVDEWHQLQIDNVNWEAGTYDLYIDRVKYSGIMHTSSHQWPLFQLVSKWMFVDNFNCTGVIEWESIPNPIAITPLPEPIPITPPFDISKFDFCIEIDFMLNNLFKWISYADGDPNYEVQYYGILGQFDQDESGEIVEGGNYWSLYLRVNAGYTTDVIFEVFDQGTMAIQLVHRTEISWSAWNEITKTNLDEYLHIAVSRNGYDMRLFVDGQYSDVVGSSGTLDDDFTTINGDLQAIGPSGQGDTGQPLSVTSVKNFVVYDNAYYWDDYIYEDWVRGTGIGLCVALRLRLAEGEPGTMRARLAI